ncbi:hypothetical protein FA95DRAFT_528934 [Auriscalpium vulgare]|uniref:Uncharacterized protein n=1 Tax=Auriscalpium vulgare TaxID=40419 RepID=A0ACB8S3Z9_9AGAM|nr:hypothetical protein FA95DRAFT_528934 [Auriscalpium vulgare]
MTTPCWTLGPLRPREILRTWRIHTARRSDVPVVEAKPDKVSQRRLIYSSCISCAAHLGAPNFGSGKPQELRPYEVPRVPGSSIDFEVTTLPRVRVPEVKSPPATPRALHTGMAKLALERCARRKRASRHLLLRCLRLISRLRVRLPYLELTCRNAASQPNKRAVHMSAGLPLLQRPSGPAIVVCPQQRLV